MRDRPSDRRRLYEKLVRELVRCESRVAEHAPREAQRIGDEVPPALALQAVADHATAMRPRLGLALSESGAPGAFVTTMTTMLRARVVDRMIDAERAYRGALLDLRHGLDVVAVLRDVARCERVFAMIRWCDDWLAARRPLVARVEAQLGWFADSQRADDPAERGGTPTRDSS